MRRELGTEVECDLCGNKLIKADQNPVMTRLQLVRYSEKGDEAWNAKTYDVCYDCFPSFPSLSSDRNGVDDKKGLIRKWIDSLTKP